MIVVFMDHCALSTSLPGNGSDLGIRQTWLPLFDKYEVDLVLLRARARLRAQLPGPRLRRRLPGHRRLAEPGPDQGRAGQHPRPARGHDRLHDAQRYTGMGHPAGHRVPRARRRRHRRTDQHLRQGHRDGLPQAKVITERNAISGSQAAGFARNAADSIEDAPWSAAINAKRRLRLRDLRRRPRQEAWRHDDHVPVLRHPGRQRRDRPPARRHDHAALDADREVRLRPRHLRRRQGPRPRHQAALHNARVATAHASA